MNQTLQEFVDSHGVRMRVNAGEGVIRGVKILGLKSRNGRVYLPDALSGAAPLYEGVKVNVNHAKGNPLGPRDYQDRIGTIRNVVVRPGEGLFADFHFNPKHILAEQLIWDAQHAPENVGFSHNVQARTVRRGDRQTVEAITKVQSVDLVADPATTRGLFESAPAGKRQGEDALRLAELTVEDLKRYRPELVEKLLVEQTIELERLESQLERLQLADALQKKRQAIQHLLREFKLPDPEACEGSTRPIVSQRFIDSLLVAPDERAMRELVEERAQLVRSASGFLRSQGGATPLSRDQNQVDDADPFDTRTFVEAIT